MMSCEEIGNCPMREREGGCEGCIMIKALDYGENSFDGSDADDEEVESEEEDQSEDLIPEEDQLEEEEEEEEGEGEE